MNKSLNNNYFLQFPPTPAGFWECWLESAETDDYNRFLALHWLRLNGLAGTPMSELLQFQPLNAGESTVEWVARLQSSIDNNPWPFLLRFVGDDYDMDEEEEKPYIDELVVGFSRAHGLRVIPVPHSVDWQYSTLWFPEFGYDCGPDDVSLDLSNDL